MVGTAAAVVLHAGKWFSHVGQNNVHRHFTMMVAGTLELLVAVIYGAWHSWELRTTSTLTVAVVPQALDQPIAQAQEAIANGESTVSLVVWPELATVRMLSTAEPDDVADEFQRLANAIGAPMLLGCWRMDESDGLVIHNSVVLVTRQLGVVTKYDKMFLTPVLETDCLPAWTRRWLPAGAASRFPTFPYSAGNVPGIFRLPIDSNKECHFAVGICHDVCFAAWGWESMISTPRPAFLVQCANETVDQGGRGQTRLLACARLRAIESGREVVRCVAGGVSTVIDHCGRLQDGTQSRPWTIPFLAEVRCYDGSLSIYHRIGGDRGVSVGLTLIWLSVFVNGFVANRPSKTKRLAHLPDGNQNTTGSLQ